MIPVLLTCTVVLLLRSGNEGSNKVDKGPALSKSEGFVQASVRRVALSSDATSRLSDDLRRYAARDLDEALDYGKSLEGLKSKQALLSLLWASIGEHPDFVAKNLFHVQIPESERVALMAEVVKRWQDYDAALVWLDDAPKGEHSGEMYGLLLARIANDSPVAALNLLDELRGETRDMAAKLFLANWSSSDPKSALENLSFLTKEIDKLLVKKIATYSLSATLKIEDLEDVLVSWTDISNDSNENVATGDVAALAVSLVSKKLKEQSPSEVFSWIAEMPTDVSKAAMLPILKKWVVDNSNAAIDAFDSLDSSERAVIGPKLVESWSNIEPESTGAWVVGYEESVEKVAMVESLIGEWSRIDPIAAYSWLNQLSPGESRDAGIVQLILKERSSDPESAMLWAREISDSALSQRHVDFLTRSLFKEEE